MFVVKRVKEIKNKLQKHGYDISNLEDQHIKILVVLQVAEGFMTAIRPFADEQYEDNHSDGLSYTAVIEDNIITFKAYFDGTFDIEYYLEDGESS